MEGHSIFDAGDGQIDAGEFNTEPHFDHDINFDDIDGAANAEISQDDMQYL